MSSPNSNLYIYKRIMNPRHIHIYPHTLYEYTMQHPLIPIPIPIPTAQTTTTMTMQAALYNATPYHLTISSLPIPPLDSPTSALVRITTSAICGSDLHIYHGLQGGPEPPWVMGHEAMGYVAEVGESVTALNVGDYVVVPDRVASGHLDMFPPGDHSFGAGGELGGLQGLPSLSLLYSYCV